MTSDRSGNLPFDRTFTPEDEYCVPIKVIGEAHNRWARKYGIVGGLYVDISSHIF